MNDILIKWILPTERETNTPLPPEDIDFVKIEMSINAGQSFTLIDDFPTTILDTLVADNAFGEWLVRATVYLINGKRSVPAMASIRVSDDSAPKPVVLTLELQ